MIILANPRSDWNVLRPLLFESIGQTLTMVLVTLVIGGFLGLILGVVLYGTRPGNLFENAVVYRILDIIVNIVRPIPFIIFLAAMQPLTIVVVGTSIGTVAAIFPMVVMCTFATSRLVEQNLVPVDPGVIEAARSMGAGKLTIIRTVLIPEALAPLILAYAFLFIGVLDMSAMAGYIGGGGLGNFAIAYGYQKFDQTVTWTAVIIMIACLLLTGTVTLIAYNINLSIIDLQQSNEIVVFIDDSLTTREARALATEFERIDNIATVDFEDRDEALEIYRQQLGEDADILADFDSSNNPLRNSYIFTLKDPTQAEQTIEEIQQVEGTDRIRADEEVISKLIQVQRVFNIISLAMVVALTLISIFIIANTVKLAMFARREEISIQKMVGATNWFIRWPFVIEGMVLGLLSGGLAFFAEWGLYNEMARVVGDVIPYFQVAAFDSVRMLVLGIYLGAGVLFGIGGSVTSIRKFMNV